MDGILVRSDNTSTAFHINHCKSQGNAFARCAEQGCRYAVPPKASSGRVETKPSCGSDDLGEVWQSRSRPVCFGNVDILSTVVLSLITNHSIGAGCTDSSLARPSPVCLPSTSTTNAQTSQNRQMPPHSTAAGSILAGKDIYVWFYVYPVIRRLLNGVPWLLPRREILLSQLPGYIWHPHPDRLQFQHEFLRACCGPDHT